jgi:hypothetical protein
MTISRPPPKRSAMPLRLGAVLLLAALAVGFVAGRFATRPRGGSLSINGTVPKRTEVLLDGKKLTFAEGVPMPVPVGAHTLTIASPRTGKREVPFNVRPGEHVVFLNSPRGVSPSASGQAIDDDGP